MQKDRKKEKQQKIGEATSKTYLAKQECKFHDQSIQTSSSHEALLGLSLLLHLSQ